MRAIVFSELGAAGVLRLAEREPAVPGPGEVRVRIVRSAVNPTDWKARRGAPGRAALFAEMVPNQDGAGVVDALGPGVPGLTVGDRVWVTLAAIGRPTGTAQEFTVLPADRVFRLPDGASFELGADLGVPAVTAHRALTVREGGPATLGPGALAGRTVLVQGGAGAVGNAAIQLAVWAGARVIASVSSAAKARLARAAGADQAVDYRREDVAERVRALVPDGVDIVVEVAPAANLATDLRLVRSRGTIAVYASDGGDQLKLDAVALLMADARLQPVFIPALRSAELRAAAEVVTAAAAAGAFGVGEEHGLPLHHYPLEQAAAAHAAVESGTVGKVLIDVTEWSGLSLPVRVGPGEPVQHGVRDLAGGAVGEGVVAGQAAEDQRPGQDVDDLRELDGRVGLAAVECPLPQLGDDPVPPGQEVLAEVGGSRLVIDAGGQELGECRAAGLAGVEGAEPHQVLGHVAGQRAGVGNGDGGAHQLGEGAGGDRGAGGPVVVDGHLADAGARGDRVDGRRGQPALVEELAGHLEQELVDAGASRPGRGGLDQPAPGAGH